MTINSYILIIWAHFIADFVSQSDEVAINKSKDINCLVWHCSIYGIVMLIFGAKFALINAVLHFFVDYVTSRITSYLWMKEQRHWFFVTVGFDQAIHLTCLFLSMKYIQLIF